jgi:hypothetical protein
VAGWETGKHGIRGGRVRRVAEILGVDVVDLIGKAA